MSQGSGAPGPMNPGPVVGLDPVLAFALALALARTVPLALALTLVRCVVPAVVGPRPCPRVTATGAELASGDRLGVTELPELPELPEFPEVAVPVAVAGPVLPESALPEAASVLLELDDVALPVDPPVVEPVAELSPLEPDVRGGLRVVGRTTSLTADGRTEGRCPTWTPGRCGCRYSVVATKVMPVRYRRTGGVLTPASPAAHSAFIRRLLITAVSFRSWTCRSGTDLQVLRGAQ